MTLLDAAGTDPVPAAPAPGELCLVRHGETEWSRSGRHTSVSDVPLTKTGERQARALGRLLADVCPALVLTSPRERARRTAELAGLAEVCPVETEQVHARADRLLDRIRAALATGPVVAIGHGHFSRVLAARWLGLPVASGGLFVLGPASPCLLGHEHGRPAIHRWNVPNPGERDPG